MEKDLLDSILNFNENGYMALPRKLAELIINQIPIRSAGTLYFYMLVYANFGDGKTNQGVKLIRGSIYLTPGDIMKLTGWSRSTAHEKIKLLEMSGLIERFPKTSSGCPTTKSIAEKACVCRSRKRSGISSWEVRRRRSFRSSSSTTASCLKFSLRNRKRHAANGEN